MRNKSLAAFFCTLLAAFSVILPKLTLAYEQEISSLSSAIAGKASAAGKKAVAVVDFTDLQGNVTELGRFLAEELSVSLSGAGKGFDVVDRTHLKSLLSEHKLSSTGLIDPKTARELGKIAGVDALVTGTITPFGDSIRLSIKVLDTETAKVISASTANIAKTKAIEELLTRGIGSVQSTGRQVPAAGSISSPNNQNAKKVGDLMVTMKDVVVSSKERVGVIMDFLNQSDKELKLAAATGAPRLTDERGNVFSFEGYNGGSQYHRGTFKWENDGVGLNAKSKSTVVLYFKPRDIDSISKIGTNFAVSFDYVLFDRKDESESHHSVSFADIAAQSN
jgi:curli biogenesis system outer membrane secretion channel CsgG